MENSYRAQNLIKEFRMGFQEHIHNSLVSKNVYNRHSRAISALVVIENKLRSSNSEGMKQAVLEKTEALDYLRQLLKDHPEQFVSEETLVYRKTIDFIYSLQMSLMEIAEKEEKERKENAVLNREEMIRKNEGEIVRKMIELNIF